MSSRQRNGQTRRKVPREPAIRYRCDNDQEDPVRDRSDEGESPCLRSCPQHRSCEQSQALHSSCGASELSVFMAPERTSRTSDRPASTRGARRRPRADSRATRRSRSCDRAACQCQESRPRRSWIEPATGLAAVQRRLCCGTCASPRGVVSTDRSVGHSLGQASPEQCKSIVPALAKRARTPRIVVLQRGMLSLHAAR